MVSCLATAVNCNRLSNFASPVGVKTESNAMMVSANGASLLRGDWQDNRIATIETMSAMDSFVFIFLNFQFSIRIIPFFSAYCTISMVLLMPSF